MKVCLVSLRRALLVIASGLILTFATFSPTVAAQEAVVDAEGLPPLPLSLIDRARQDGSALLLSLTEVTKMALQHNLDIAIADTNEEDRRLSLISAYTTFDPTLSVNFSTNSRTSVSTNFEQVAAGSGTTSSSGNSWGATFRKQFMQTGGTLSSNIGGGRNSSTSINTASLSYSSSFSISYSQPLWRNLRMDNARNQIRLANLNIEQNDLQFRSSVTNVIGNIQTAYWDLVSAVRNYEIQRNALRIAQINMRDTQRRLDVGTVAPINLIQSQASATRTEVSLVQAEDQIVQTQNRLKQLISNDRNADIWKRTIVPTDLPDFVEYTIDIETAIATALRNRNEIHNSRISMTRLEWSNELARNQKKWDITPSFQFGKSGNAFPDNPCRREFGLEGPCRRDPETGNEVLTYDPKYHGGFFTAYNTLFSTGAYNWQASINVTLPIWNRTNDIQLAQNEIQRRQEVMRLRQTEQNIQVEIMNAVQSLENSRLQVMVARVNLDVQRELHEAEMKRYEAGLTDNARVLDAAQALSTSENSELTAIINYRRAVISLQRAMNTLLEESQFTVARGSSANIADLR